ncbi:MAG: DnaA N-terminal domain-containing protein, partial [Ilumatobacteraceae bacterium]
MSDQDQVWTAVAQHLRDQLTDGVWYSTFQDVVPLEANGDHLAISVPSNHVRDRILTRYLPLVTEALDDIVAPGCSLDIVVAAGSSAADNAEEQPMIRGPAALATRLATGPDGSSV